MVSNLVKKDTFMSCHRAALPCGGGEQIPQQAPYGWGQRVPHFKLQQITVIKSWIYFHPFSLFWGGNTSSEFRFRFPKLITIVLWFFGAIITRVYRAPASVSGHLVSVLWCHHSLTHAIQCPSLSSPQTTPLPPHLQNANFNYAPSTLLVCCSIILFGRNIRTILVLYFTLWFTLWAMASCWWHVNNISRRGQHYHAYNTDSKGFHYTLVGYRIHLLFERSSQTVTLYKS